MYFLELIKLKNTEANYLCGRGWMDLDLSGYCSRMSCRSYFRGPGDGDTELEAAND